MRASATARAASAARAPADVAAEASTGMGLHDMKTGGEGVRLPWPKVVDISIR